MAVATLDILDSLAPGYDEFMKLSDQYHFKACSQNIKISPKYWEENYPIISQYTYSWTEIKYTGLKAHLNGNPATANGVGVYFFIVKPDVLIHSLPGFVFYVGIAGENESRRTLNERLCEYLQVSQISKREAVHLALQKYYKNTYIVYSIVDLPPADLRALEEAFHGFYHPWAGKRDFPATIKKQQKAWGEI